MFLAFLFNFPYFITSASASSKIASIFQDKKFMQDQPKYKARHEII